MKIVFEKAEMFRDLVNATAVICDEAVFKFSDAGLRIREMDPSREAY